jgi:hypothetical protein
MNTGSAHPLSMEYVRNLDRNGFRIPVGQRAIEAVSQEYIRMYGAQGLVELVWDEKCNKHKYLNLGGNWVWYE